MNQREEKIVVIGLGYVGLPLAVSLARHFDVLGLDIDAGRVEELKRGFDRTDEVDPSALAASTLKLTADPDACRGASVYVVTVPTPVDAINRPDLKPLEAASATVGRNLRREVEEGAVFGDPPSLTSGGEGWDALEACRKLQEKTLRA